MTADDLRAAVRSLPAEFAPLLVGDWLARLANRLGDWQVNGPPAHHPPPFFDVEVTPAPAELFAPFRDAHTRPALADGLMAAGWPGVLALLGQRRTPASLTDARGLPPPRSVLLASASSPLGARQRLSVAARAWAKHAARSADGWWGVPSGGEDARNAVALALVARVLDGATWWNTFGHFAHESAFEARLPSGHGVRWEADGAKFVGFLEPFRHVSLPDQRSGLYSVAMSSSQDGTSQSAEASNGSSSSSSPES